MEGSEVTKSSVYSGESHSIHVACLCVAEPQLLVHAWLGWNTFSELSSACDFSVLQ